MSAEETNEKPKPTEMKRVLVFGGKSGWIGNLMCEMMEKEGKNWHSHEVDRIPLYDFGIASKIVSS
jgi:hypothetical protein